MHSSEELLKILNTWIVKIKKDAYAENIKSDNAEDMMKYKFYLEDLERSLRMAIINEDITKLQALRWPEELMESIKDTVSKTYILDCIEQAFTVNHFNKSPNHEIELKNNELNNTG